MGKQILPDVCAQLSYLRLGRNSSSRTSDNVVMKITLASLFVCCLPPPPYYQPAEGGIVSTYFWACYVWPASNKISSDNIII